MVSQSAPIPWSQAPVWFLNPERAGEPDFYELSNTQPNQISITCNILIQLIGVCIYIYTVYK